MSKLDNIILECVNKALAGLQEKLGDYIDPTKEQIKDLFHDLVDDEVTATLTHEQLHKRINEL